MEALEKHYPGENCFKLQQLIEESLHRFKLNRNHSEISLHLIDDLVSPLSIKGNREKLQNVLNLLFVNAVSLGKASKIIISLKQLLKTQNEVLLEFSVEDNGTKYSKDADEPNCIYRRNLAEIRTSIEEFGGKTEISCLEGVGTTIKFLVKFFWEEDGDEVEKLSLKKLINKKILVAEDNEINQKIIAHLLRRENIETDIANDGKEAIELFEKKTYDLLLLDLQMPNMDGFQTAKYIRKILGSDIPIVAMTAGAYPNEQVRCFEIGINQYLSKPFAPADLFQQLNYFLLNEHNITCPKKSAKIATKNVYSITSLKETNEEWQIIEILEMFVNQTPDLLTEIKSAAETENIDAVIRKTAKLKGSLGSLQMHNMMKAADEIEVGVRMADTQKIAFSIENLYKEYDVVAPLLQKDLNKMKIKV